MADEVVAWLQTCRYGDGPRAVIGYQLAHTPKASGQRAADQAGLVDLEPNGAGWVVGGAVTATGSQPNDDGTQSVRPGVVPVGGNCGTSCDGRLEGTERPVGVALHCGLRGIQNGVIRVPLPLHGNLSSRGVVGGEAKDA